MKKYKTETVEQCQKKLEAGYEGIHKDLAKEAVEARAKSIWVAEESSGVAKGTSVAIDCAKASAKAGEVKKEKETRKVSGVQKVLNKVNDLGKEIPKLNKKSKEKAIEAVAELLTALSEEG